MDKPTFITVCIIAGFVIAGILWFIVNKLAQRKVTKEKLLEDPQVMRIRAQWEYDWEFEKLFQYAILGYLTKHFLPALLDQVFKEVLKNTTKGQEAFELAYNHVKHTKSLAEEVVKRRENFYNMISVINYKKEVISKICEIPLSQIETLLVSVEKISQTELDVLLLLNKHPKKYDVYKSVKHFGYPKFIYIFDTTKYNISAWIDGARFLTEDNSANPKALIESFKLRWDVDLQDLIDLRIDVLYLA